MQDDKPNGKKSELGWGHWLLLIPMFCIWVPFYNRIEPEVFSFPFFYWFQLIWIFVSMGITGLVYYLSEQQ